MKRPPRTNAVAVLVLLGGQRAVAGAGAGEHVALVGVADAHAVLGEHEAHLDGAAGAVAVLVHVEASLRRADAEVILVQDEALFERTHGRCGERGLQYGGPAKRVSSRFDFPLFSMIIFLSI